MSTAPETRVHCRAITRGGEPCRAWALPGQPWCFSHSDRAPEWHAKGGRARSRAARAKRALPDELRTIADLLGSAFGQTFQRQMEPAVAHALANLAGALVKVLGAGEQEQRLRELERALAEQQAERAAYEREGVF